MLTPPFPSPEPIKKMTPDEIRIYNKKERRIDFLLERQFGIPSGAYVSKQVKSVRDVIASEEVQFLRDDHCGTLNLLPERDFKEQYRDELLDFRSEAIRYRKAPNSTERHRYTKMDAWSPREALSLWLGSIPYDGEDIVVWANKNERLTKHARKILSRWRLIERGLEARKLTDLIEPIDFVQWARRFGLPQPEIFADVLSQNDMPDCGSEGVQKLQVELDTAREEISILKKLISQSNLLKNKEYMELFGALVVGVYGFDASRKNHHATPNIRDTIRIYFDTKDPKTIKGRIDEALASLPQDKVRDLVQSYLQMKAAEGEFDPYLGDSLSRRKNPLKRQS